MQDNPIDHKWEDEGWNMMRQLLDEEMPAAPVPAKQGAWTPTRLALLLAGIAIGLFAYWLADQRFVPTKAPTLTAFAIPMLPTEMEARTTLPLPQGQPAEPSQTTTTATPSVASSPSLPAAPNPLLATRTASRSTFNALSPAEEQAATTSSTPPLEPTTMERFNRSPDPTATDSRPAPLVARLPKLQMGLLPVLAPTLPVDPIDRATKTRRFDYGLETSIGSANFSQLQAWSAGIFAQLPLGEQSKWHARLSLGYQQVLQTRTANTHTFLLGNTRFPATVGSVVLQSRTQLTQLDYLYFLPQLSYRLHPRWNVEAGVQYAYLAAQRNNTSWSVFNNTPEPSTPSDSEEEALLGDLPESLSNSNLPLSQHQLSLQLGLRYQINPRLSAAAQWQQGLTSIYPQGGRSTYNRFLSVGVGCLVR